MTGEGGIVLNMRQGAERAGARIGTLDRSDWLAGAALGLLLCLGAPEAFAQQATPAPSPAPPKATDVGEVVVNGIPYRETVLPTRIDTDSVFGLNLNVMDTPRNTTLLSTTQLETLNIQDPRAFSYLTSSSYSDSSFGTPNIPRIRGQYGDVYYNGMRYSFTQNGYGVPLNYDSLENISITKGPATVVDGPGPDVGGEVDFLTKRPSLQHFSWGGEASVDTIGNHRWVLDVGGPIVAGDLGFRLSYSGENSNNTYFYGHFMHKNALYLAVRWEPNSRYKVDFNTEINVEQYTEEVGVNRVNQNLINNFQYLQGGPDGVEYDSSILCANNCVPIPTGLAAGTGNPYVAAPFLTETNLTGTARLDPHVTIDETPGVESHGLLYNAQLIQSFQIDSHLTLKNNTFFALQDSDNYEPYYYSDSSNGSYTIENKLTLNGDYDLKFAGITLRNQFVLGATVRFAHVNYISNFSTETVSVYDLTGNHDQWAFYPPYQALADAFPYQSPFNHLLYGVPGRDVVNFGNTGISDLWDEGIFFQDRVEFTPQFSALFGARIDTLQNHTHDPLGGAVCDFCFTDLPQDHTTGIYGLGEGNLSLVYKPAGWISSYLTFDWTQSTNPNGGEGGINSYGQVADSLLMRSDNYLYEAGLKLNLLDNRLFGGLAVFDQKRKIPSGPGNTLTTPANIRGVEVEFNYQPTRDFFATASYSYIDTTLSSAPLFYDYPAQPGLNVDGAGLTAVFYPGQKFQDPGVPQHVFNFLANYKFPFGIGLRTGIQVTGPIPITASGRIDVAASENYYGVYAPQLVPAYLIANGGVYQSPVIPWQYTWNAAVFYQIGRYTFTASVYNLTNQRNWQPSPNLYGNDFLVLSDPRTFEFRIQAKF
jgi:hypothetical protein